MPSRHAIRENHGSTEKENENGGTMDKIFTPAEGKRFATDDIVEGQGQLRVMTSDGDYKAIWNKDNDDEVEAVRKQFDDFKKKGYTAYHVKKDGEKGRLMRTFDSKAEKIIMVPQMRGG
jgi:hypothetical protein